MIFACYLTLINIIKPAGIDIVFKFNDRNYLVNIAYSLSVSMIVTSIILKFSWCNKWYYTNEN